MTVVPLVPHRDYSEAHLCTVGLVLNPCMPKVASCTVSVLKSQINTCTSGETYIQSCKCMFLIQFSVLYYPWSKRPRIPEEVKHSDINQLAFNRQIYSSWISVKQWEVLLTSQIALAKSNPGVLQSHGRTLLGYGMFIRAWANGLWCLCIVPPLYGLSSRTWPWSSFLITNWVQNSSYIYYSVGSNNQQFLASSYWGENV